MNIIVKVIEAKHEIIVEREKVNVWNHQLAEFDESDYFLSVELYVMYSATIREETRMQPMEYNNEKVAILDYTIMLYSGEDGDIDLSKKQQEQIYKSLIIE